jgi:hypothetical protein
MFPSVATDRAVAPAVRSQPPACHKERFCGYRAAIPSEPKGTPLTLVT